MNSFGIVEFDIEDIVRSKMIKEYIIRKEQYESKTIRAQPLHPAFAQ